VAHWFRAKVRQEPRSQNPALRPGYAAHFCLRDDLDLSTARSGRGVSWQLKAHHSLAASTWKKAHLWWIVTAGVLDLHESFNHGPRRCVCAKVTAYRPSRQGRRLGQSEEPQRTQTPRILNKAWTSSGERVCPAQKGQKTPRSRKSPDQLPPFG
jgi:hypothetical protein